MEEERDHAFSSPHVGKWALRSLGRSRGRRGRAAGAIVSATLPPRCVLRPLRPGSSPGHLPTMWGGKCGAPHPAQRATFSPVGEKDNRPTTRFPDERSEIRDPGQHHPWAPDRFASGERSAWLRCEPQPSFRRKFGPSFNLALGSGLRRNDAGKRGRFPRRSAAISRAYLALEKWTRRPSSGLLHASRTSAARSGTQDSRLGPGSLRVRGAFCLTSMRYPTASPRHKKDRQTRAWRSSIAVARSGLETACIRDNPDPVACYAGP